MKIYKSIAKNFFKEGGWVSFAINTVLIWAIKTSITKSLDWWSISLSASVSFFMFFLTNFITIQTKQNMLDDSIKIEFDTEKNLSIIKQHVILYNYFRNSLAQIVENSQIINSQSKLELDPYQIYSHIIFATQHFKEKIYSVDCDIDAWYYICTEEDFDQISGLRTNEKDKIDYLKESYLNEYIDRRRIDLTYNISSILMEKDKENKLLGMGCVKRIFIIEKKDIDCKILVILAALQRINETTRCRICNQYIFWDGVNSEIKDAIKELQDIIIFDKMIAYQEYTLKDAKGSSSIITDNDIIKNHIEQFDVIKKAAKKIDIKSIIKDMVLENE